MTPGTGEVTDQLLAMIEAWRDRLGKHIALRNPTLRSGELDTAVHGIISRMIFLRICENRGIERPGTLRGLLEGEGGYRRLLDHLPYSEGHGDSEPPVIIGTDLTIDENIFDEIREQLYNPGSPLEFSAITPTILGQVCDQFLGKTLRLRGGHHAQVEEKPEVKAGGGLHDVPQFAVEYVVRKTIGELVKGKTPEEASRLRILDPACGSGSFLIGACRFLFDWHLDWYVRNLVPVLTAEGSFRAPGVQVLIPARPGEGTGNDGVPRELPICRIPGGGEPGGAPGWMLTTTERERILRNTIHGVDIDPRAVDAARLSLLLTVLWEAGREMPEGEAGPVADRLLRCLHLNIRCGNSLVGPDYFRQKQVAPYNFREEQKINPFDWKTGFPGIMGASGFDAVIGQPPSTQDRPVKGVEEYFQTHYRAYHAEADLSVYFMEKGIYLLRPGGTFSAVVANRWLRAGAGTPLRKWLKEKQIEEIVDLGNLQVFQDSAVYPCLIRVRNAPVSHGFQVSKPDTLSFPSIEEYVREHHHPVDPAGLTDGGWTLTDSRPGKILRKIREEGTPLDSLIIPRDDKYLFGVLNSRLARLFFKASRSQVPQDPDLQARVVQKDFPVYVPDFDDPADTARHDRMVALVTRMLDLRKRLHDTTLEHGKTIIQRQIEVTDREIDDLVYELYGLTEEERRIVEEATGGTRKGT
jgi:hypothetical protein